MNSNIERKVPLHTALEQCLRHAIERVRMANAEGNPILSAWLAEAIALLETPAAAEVAEAHTNHQPDAPWRVEFRECGISSRFWVVRGFPELGPIDVHGDFVHEADALGQAEILNAPQGDREMPEASAAANQTFTTEVCLKDTQRSPVCLVTDEGNCFALVYLTEHGSRRRSPQSEEYARRLVACWNACVGMGTEDVESWAAENKRKRAALEADEQLASR